MDRFSNLYFIFYLTTLLVWLFRARLASEILLRVPSIPSVTDLAESVTIIVPAKNEEANLPECLHRLLHQTAKSIQIIIINDNSTDQTEKVLQSFGFKQIEPGKDNLDSVPKYAYLNASKTPSGWTGKNFAIYSAIPWAKHRWLLFTDADTQHELHSVASAVSFAESRDLSFLTLAPRCLVSGFTEKTFQPLAMAFLGLWFPLTKANQKGNAIKFGNGQFLLVERNLYRDMGGHEAVKAEFLEDYALMGKAKASGRNFLCALGNQIYGTRMYNSFSSLYKGWRRIYLHAFERDPSRIAPKALNLSFFSTLPFLLIYPLYLLAFLEPEKYGVALGLSSVTLIFILVTGWRAYGIIGAPPAYSLLQPFSTLLMVWILLDVLRLALLKKAVTWR